MGTRATTRVVEGRQPYVNLYRQMDGYPKVHGQELFEFLRGRCIVNGITDWNNRLLSNGAGCLAASLVAHFKKGIGGFYLMSSTHHREEWDYLIRVPQPGKPIRIEVRNDIDGGKPLKFKGTVEEFGEWLVMGRGDGR